MENENLTIPQGLDGDAVNLARSIRKQESGGDYNKSGDSGSSLGAYQWNNQPNGKSIPLQKGELPSNFTAWAKEANLDPTDFSPHNQDMVAYNKIKKLKDSGKNVVDIAAIWNGGDSKRQDPNYITPSGLPSQKAGAYDVPAYAKAVNDNYQNLKTKTSGQTPQPQPVSQGTQSSNQNSYASQIQGFDTKPTIDTTSTEQTLGKQLGQRGTDIGSAAQTGTQGFSDIIKGDVIGGASHVTSGLIQGAGAIAGGLGDIVNKVIEKTPIVGTVFKGIESLIGGAAKGFFNTEIGKSVATSIGDFSQKHPELAKDFGAGINIVTAIPILKGLGMIKNVALDAASSALKNYAEKAMTKDLTEIASKTIKGRDLLNVTPGSVKTLVTERALPDIIDGKLSVKEAYEKLGSSISNIEDNKLQPILQKLNTTGVDTRRPLEELRQQAIAEVKTELRATGQVSKAESEINRVFDDYKSSYGDYVTLDDINNMKRGIRKSVNFNSPKLESDVTYYIGQTFQKDIESSASRLGLADINAINQEMANLIKSQKMLKLLDGKPIKNGFVSGLVKNSATVGGEALGNLTGIPFAGALAGRSIGGNIGKKLTGGIPGILKRTGKDAERVSREELKKKLGGLFGGAVTQKMTNQ